MPYLALTAAPYYENTRQRAGADSLTGRRKPPSWWQQCSAPNTGVTFDHRGFGRTAEVENGPGGNAFAEDLRGLLDHLEVERAYLVAQSMGADLPRLRAARA
jgi:pimeloyl-ACP methyl ester carboxylesterase